jgi:transcriptional regulator with XRE-family HTH domain
MEARARGLIRDLAARMRRSGVATPQIVSTLIDRYDISALTAYRAALGLSQAQVAERYNQRWPSLTPKTFKQISYWERWSEHGTNGSSSARAPSLDDLSRLAVLYDCLVDDLLHGPRHGTAIPPTTVAVSREVMSGVLAALQEQAGDHYPGYTENDAVVALRTPIGEGTILVTISRRTFSALLATGGLTALLPDTALTPALAATSSVTDYHRRVLLAHQAGHHLLSPAAHIAALADTLREIAASREGAPTKDRHALRGLQAEIAEHLSWLHRETGDLDGCRQWANKATACALEVGDTAMATYMMLRTATLALGDRDFSRAIELAQAAQHTRWETPPTLRAVALLYETRGHAATGTINAAALDTADELLATDPGPESPAYLRFFGPSFAQLQRATCYMTGGRPGLAVTILQSQLTGLPPNYHRDRAVHLARLGIAHAADKTPDAAAIAGIASLAEAHRSESKHVVAELQPLRDLLNHHWPDQPKVREFHAALAAS